MPGERAKPHISPTQIDTYLRCGEQYRRRYVLGEKIPPGVALVKGSAVHRAAEVNYRQKLESRADLPVPDLQEAAASHGQEMVARDGLMLAPDEATKGMAKVRGEILDRAVVLTGLFAQRVAPSVQPVLVEEGIGIELPNCSHDLFGRLDVTDEENRVRDLKTAGRRKNADEVQRSDQLTFYHLAFQRKMGRPPAGVRLDVLVDKARPEVQTLEAERTPRDAAVFVSRLNAVLSGIKTGSFPPAPIGAWCCSARYCGYWFTCPYVNSERQAAAEAQEI